MIGVVLCSVFLWGESEFGLEIAYKIGYAGVSRSLGNVCYGEVCLYQQAHAEIKLHFLDVIKTADAHVLVEYLSEIVRREEYRLSDLLGRKLGIPEIVFDIGYRLIYIGKVSRICSGGEGLSGGQRLGLLVIHIYELKDDIAEKMSAYALG